MILTPLNWRPPPDLDRERPRVFDHILGFDLFRLRSSVQIVFSAWWLCYLCWECPLWRQNSTPLVEMKDAKDPVVKMDLPPRNPCALILHKHTVTVWRGYNGVGVTDRFWPPGSRCLVGRRLELAPAVLSAVRWRPRRVGTAPNFASTFDEPIRAEAEVGGSGRTWQPRKCLSSIHASQPSTENPPTAHANSRKLMLKLLEEKSSAFLARCMRQLRRP